MLSILLRNVVNKDLLEVVVENVYISTKGDVSIHKKGFFKD